MRDGMVMVGYLSGVVRGVKMVQGFVLDALVRLWIH